MENKLHSLCHVLYTDTNSMTSLGCGSVQLSQESYGNNMISNNYNNIYYGNGFHASRTICNFEESHSPYCSTKTCFPTISQRRIENYANPSFASTNSICYPETKKEDTKMSFVGIYVCDDGLVAFGDSKSSKQTSLGSFMSNGDNNVKKVFKGHDFLVVTYGLNEILEAPYVIARLEKVIEPMIRQAHDYKDFLFMLHSHLQEVNESDKYTFIFGVKDKKGYKVVRYAVSNMSIEYIGGPNWRLTCDGVLFYTSRKENIECAITSNRVEVVKEVLPIAIKKIIAEADAFDIYNPVGGEIQIETLQ